jgi:hypothetical protein
MFFVGLFVCHLAMAIYVVRHWSSLKPQFRSWRIGLSAIFPPYSWYHVIKQACVGWGRMSSGTGAILGVFGSILLYFAFVGFLGVATYPYGRPYLYTSLVIFYWIGVPAIYLLMYTTSKRT